MPDSVEFYRRVLGFRSRSQQVRRNARSLPTLTVLEPTVPELTVTFYGLTEFRSNDLLTKRE